MKQLKINSVTVNDKNISLEEKGVFLYGSNNLPPGNNVLLCGAEFFEKYQTAIAGNVPLSEVEDVRYCEFQGSEENDPFLWGTFITSKDTNVLDELGTHILSHFDQKVGNTVQETQGEVSIVIHTSPTIIEDE